MVIVGWWPALNRPLTLFPSHLSLSSSVKKRSYIRSSATLGGEHGRPFLPATAIESATLRFQESNRPDPLFIDPYVGCFLSSVDQQCPIPLPVSESEVIAPSYYSLATRFIDDTVLGMMSRDDELRQVVLLTDGIDTRPFRLQWPRSTLIFDVSPTMVFVEASKRLKGIGAKVAQTSILLHIPLESPDLQEILYLKGFSGSKPSIWILQGLPVMALVEFSKILSIVSNLSMKGCIFLGELPHWLVETELRSKVHHNNSLRKWMDNTFMSNGFRVDVIDYNEVARDLGRNPPSGVHDNFIFVARQLRLSDEQMEKWRSEFQRIEEDGDEEGFEDLLF